MRVRQELRDDARLGDDLVIVPNRGNETALFWGFFLVLVLVWPRILLRWRVTKLFLGVVGKGVVGWLERRKTVHIQDSASDTIPPEASRDR